MGHAVFEIVTPESPYILFLTPGSFTNPLSKQPQFTGREVPWTIWQYNRITDRLIFLLVVSTLVRKLSTRRTNFLQAWTAYP